MGINFLRFGWVDVTGTWMIQNRQSSVSPDTNLDSNYECRIPMFVTFLQTPDIGAIAILVHIDIGQHTSSTRHPTNSLVTTREQEYSEYLRIFGDIWAMLPSFSYHTK